MLKANHNSDIDRLTLCSYFVRHVLNISVLILYQIMRILTNVVNSEGLFRCRTYHLSCLPIYIFGVRFLFGVGALNIHYAGSTVLYPYKLSSPSCLFV